MGMAIDSVSNEFTRLPINGYYVIELTFDPGSHLSLTMMQDPSRSDPRGSCQTVSLSFGCVRDVQSSLRLHGSFGKIERHRARASSKKQQLKYHRKSRVYDAQSRWFSLTLTSGKLEIEAETFSLMTIGRAEVYGQ